MSRLVTFGCSNTFGDSLDNTPSDENRHIPRVDKWNNPIKPSRYAWPAKLAERLSIPLVNAGWSGASNKRIWNNMINFSYQEGDIVIVLWTNLGRHSVFHEDKKLYPHDHYGNYYDGTTIANPKQFIEFNPGWVDKSLVDRLHKNKWTNKNKECAEFYYKELHNDYDDIVDISIRIDHITRVIKDKKHVKLYHCFGKPMYDLLLPWAKNITFIQDAVVHHLWNYGLASDGVHPSQLGHKVFATKLWKWFLSERKKGRIEWTK